jgi:cobyrinic acid a,c-diamide synthase
MTTLTPRFVVAGTHSGVGKTTVATGLMAALAGRGLRVAAAKVGPDFIDPGYHRAATGRASHNLDLYLHGPELVRSLAAEAARGADVLVVEGVMGLFDGSSSVPGVPAAGSTAEVARLLQAPVVLVVDASAMSGSVAALVHGFATFDPEVRLAGVVLNRVGSPGHAALLEEALAPLGVAILGHLMADDRLAWRERHLGLVPVVEGPAAVRRSLDLLAGVVAGCLDLDAILALAAAAPRPQVDGPPAAQPAGHARVALCSGPAFDFYYPENLGLLRQAGAELVPFDPLSDESLPEECSGLYAGGGFPEVFAAEISANTKLLAQLGERVRGGLPTWAECGGLLLLCESLDGATMSGALQGVHARMTERLVIGYREATMEGAGLFGPKGTVLRGHELHRSETVPAGEALALTGRFGTGRGGFAGGDLFASYLHQHLAGAPELAGRFVARASAARLRGRGEVRERPNRAHC